MITADEFESLVADCLDQLPVEMLEPLDNVIFLIEDSPANGQEILGMYEGFSLQERENYGYGEEPDRIIMYRDNLINHSKTIEDLKREIHVTLVHEIAHFYGFDEAKVHELGWG